MLEALPVAFALFDAKVQLADWNERLARLKLFPKRLLKRGTLLADLCKHDAGLTGRVAKPRLLRLPKGGTLKASVKRVGAKQLLVTYEDVTEAHRVAERFELVERAVSEGVYDWDIVADRVFYSNRAINEFFTKVGRHGLRQGLPGKDYVALVHPEDRERYRAELLTHLKGTDERFVSEYRLSTDGVSVWMRQHGTTIRDASGRAVRMIGATADITARKKAELALERAHAETAEALDRQTATAEILKIISASPTDTRPVFYGICRSAARLFGCSAGITIVAGNQIDVVAMAHPDASPRWSDSGGIAVPENYIRTDAAREAIRNAIRDYYPQPFDPGRSLVARAINERRIVVFPNTRAAEVPEQLRNISRAMGFGAYTLVPLLRESGGVGAITLWFTEPGKALDDKQRALVQTFADQAVIAIENVRLFNETKEALERQTATAEILKVIASSPADVQPVFDSIAESAHRLLSDAEVGVTLIRRDRIELVAAAGLDEERLEALRATFPRPLDLNSGVNLTVVHGQTVHYPDVSASDVPSYTRDAVRAAGMRAMLGVPLMREGKSIGGVFVSKTTPGAYTEKQIELLRTFADQAVIAIENVRLFNETKEALAHQTAAADVLQVIGNSVADAQPVFEQILDCCESLMPNDEIMIDALGEDGMLHWRAGRGLDPARARASYPVAPPELTPAYLARGVASYADVMHGDGVPQRIRDAVGAYGTNGSLIEAAMVSQGKLIGTITAARLDLRGYTAKEDRLLRTFADQAVIAIQNARLFNETKEALERQTATADILKVIAGSPADVQPVFDAIAHSVIRLVGGHSCSVTRVLDGRLHLVALTSTDPAGDELVRSFYPMPLDGQSPMLDVVRTARTLLVRDTETDPVYGERGRQVARARGFRTIAYVPMLREGAVTGVIHLAGVQPNSLTDSHVRMLHTFADQAVIAIENVRLFNETQEALERQTATADVLRAISASPTDTRPVFDIIAERATVLCEAKDSVVLRYDGAQVNVAAHYNLPPEAREALGRVYPCTLEANGAGVQAIRSGRVVQIEDVREIPDYFLAEMAEIVVSRRILAVPLLRGGQAIGAISIAHAEPGRFSDHQIGLVRTFADQAVIAIENVRLFNETKEALERQTATAEILKVIASSPSDVQPVFDAIAHSAHRLFNRSAAFQVVRDGVLHIGAIAGFSDAGLEKVASLYPMTLEESRRGLRAMRDGRVLETTDILGPGTPAAIVAIGSAAGFRSIVTVPLLRGDDMLGQLSLTAEEVRPRLDEKQLALLKTFADQAVIAIENVRLFNETKEALEQQRASAEVLNVISNSVSDAQPVFEKIVESCERIFATSRVGLNLIGADGLVHAGAYGNFPAAEKLCKENFPHPVPASATGAAIGAGQPIQFPDALGDPAVPQYARRGAETVGFRAFIMAPLLSEGRGLGAIFVGRETVGSFSEKESALLKAFADQAVIAIENARLFNETKEALERQTATAEILKVIASSPSDVQPVFEAIARSAAQLFGSIAGILIREGDAIDLKAYAASSMGLEEQSRSFVWMKQMYPMPFDPGRNQNARIMATCQAGECLDTEAEEISEIGRDHARRGGYRSYTSVPLIREGTGIGVLSIAFAQAGVRLTDAQRTLLRSFADQAVIAIENVRLFNELQSRTEALTKSVGQLIALGEVGQAISSTLDLDKVLQTIVSRAVQLTGLDGGAIYEFDEGAQTFTLRGGENVRQEILELNRSEPIRLGDGFIGRAASTRAPVQVPDLREVPAQMRARDVLLRVGARALLAVPLLTEGHILGALAVIRNSPGEFAPETIGLLQTFATQSAIAIQNARLFREIEEKNRLVEEASKHKSQFLASMSHELRTPLNAILGFNEMLIEGMYGDVPGDMQEPLKDIQTSGKHLLRLINNVLDLAKIEAGRMELALAEYSVHDTVESVRATLRPLAAEKGLEFAVTLPEDIPLAHGDSGRITQCLVNLAGNSLKFTKTGKVEIVVEHADGRLKFSVIDTGIGIPAEKIGSLFTEFKQTDATIASEYGGSGLGLSIVKKFVEMHGGRIWVESEPGRGSTFAFEIPLRAGEATV